LGMRKKKRKMGEKIEVNEGASSPTLPNQRESDLLVPKQGQEKRKATNLWQRSHNKQLKVDEKLLHDKDSSIKKKVTLRGREREGGEHEWVGPRPGRGQVHLLRKVEEKRLKGDGRKEVRVAHQENSLFADDESTSTYHRVKVGSVENGGDWKNVG